MKKKVILQHNHKDVIVQNIENAAIEEVKAQGYKRNDIIDLDLYFNIDDMKWYYVAIMKDDEVLKGCMPFEVSPKTE